MREVSTYSVALFITSLFITGLIISQNLTSIIIGGVFLTIAFNIIKPLISTIGAPLKFITLGFFSLITTTFSLFIITLIYQGIRVVPFNFEGASIAGFQIPAFHVGIILSYIIVSGTIYVVSKLINWLYGVE